MREVNEHDAEGGYICFWSILPGLGVCVLKRSGIMYETTTKTIGKPEDNELGDLFNNFRTK